MSTHLNEVINTYRTYFPHRHERLFGEFLRQGYSEITLSSVDVWHEELLEAKIYLGMYITLLDDFADNPKLHNPALLQELYQLPNGLAAGARTQDANQQEHIVELASTITEGFLSLLPNLPNFPRYAELYNFDLQQFYNCNRYFEMLAKLSEIKNVVEMKYFSSHNMGITLVGMMDVIASSRFAIDELGKAREMFYYAQRHAKISNNLVTLEREIEENDLSNELLMTSVEEATQEQFHLRECMTNTAYEITTFDAFLYLEGIKKLHQLHEKFRGII